VVQYRLREARVDDLVIQLHKRIEELEAAVEELQSRVGPA
jgi:hypothetical protein